MAGAGPAGDGRPARPGPARDARATRPRAAPRPPWRPARRSRRVRARLARGRPARPRRPSCRPSARTAGCPARSARARRPTRAAAWPGAGRPAGPGRRPARRSAVRGTCTASRRTRPRRARPTSTGACAVRCTPSTKTRAPRSCARWAISATGGRVPIRFEAPVTATSRVRWLVASLTSSAVSSPVAGSKCAQQTVAPAASAACTHGRMLASWSSRVTTTSSPGPQSAARVRARS